MLKELTLKLQQLAADVVHAYKMVTSVVSTLSKMREESQREFHKVYLDTTVLGRKLHGDDFEIRKPRVTVAWLIKTTHQWKVQKTTIG